MHTDTHTGPRMHSFSWLPNIPFTNGCCTLLSTVISAFFCTVKEPLCGIRTLPHRSVCHRVLVYLSVGIGARIPEDTPPEEMVLGHRLCAF